MRDLVHYLGATVRQVSKKCMGYANVPQGGFGLSEEDGFHNHGLCFYARYFSTQYIFPDEVGTNSLDMLPVLSYQKLKVSRILT